MTRSSPSKADNGVPWKWQLAIAAALLLIFTAISFVMIYTADTQDAIWMRRIAVFSAFQSLVFGAVGWLFGREINRVPTEVARADAHEAREQAKSSADSAAAAEVRAVAEETKGRALSAAIDAHAATAASAGGSRDVGLDRGQPASASIAALAAMAHKLYET